jgi:hypothetical protein
MADDKPEPPKTAPETAEAYRGPHGSERMFDERPPAA